MAKTLVSGATITRDTVNQTGIYSVGYEEVNGSVYNQKQNNISFQYHLGADTLPIRINDTFDVVLTPSANSSLTITCAGCTVVEPCSMPIEVGGILQQSINVESYTTAVMAV